MCDFESVGNRRNIPYSYTVTWCAQIVWTSYVCKKIELEYKLSYISWTEQIKVAWA